MYSDLFSSFILAFVIDGLYNLNCPFVKACVNLQVAVALRAVRIPGFPLRAANAPA